MASGWSRPLGKAAHGQSHDSRLPGIARDAPRPGRTPAIAPAVLQQIVTLTTTTTPPHTTHWSTRTLARVLELNPATGPAGHDSRMVVEVLT